MTVLRNQLARIARDAIADPIPGAPEVDLTVAPTSADEAAAVLRFASEHELKVLFWGGGTHQGIGHSFQPDIVMSARSMNRIVDWQHADLTVVVGAGVLVSELEASLEQRGQTAVLPEDPGSATVGGIVAAGLSGWRRLRYGPTRDRVIEVVVATGDGRVVRGGGRLVKNVTGYDLPRLATGSLGSLGLISQVCLKLWPLTAERAMVEVRDPVRAVRVAYRPFAIIETADKAVVYLAGTPEELEEQALRLGGSLAAGHRWPEPRRGLYELTARVPASSLASVVDRVRSYGWDFVAAHGVGEVRIAVDEDAPDAITELRRSVEAGGGAVVIAAAPDSSSLDPWGTPPGSLQLQRRVKAAFDPYDVANPGRLPGGI
jgi:glycolate oxidase FAD binding subunit